MFSHLLLWGVGCRPDFVSTYRSQSPINLNYFHQLGTLGRAQTTKGLLLQQGFLLLRCQPGYKMSEQESERNKYAEKQVLEKSPPQ